MNFIKSIDEKDIEKTFENIDKNKKIIFSYLKNSGLEIAEIMKKTQKNGKMIFTRIHLS